MDFKKRCNKCRKLEDTAYLGGAGAVDSNDPSIYCCAGTQGCNGLVEAVPLYCLLESSNPHTTLFLVVEYTDDYLPEITNLKEQFHKAGWTDQEEMDFYDQDFDGQLRPVGEVELLHKLQIGKPGTGLFQGWTSKERLSNMRQLRYILKKIGIGGKLYHRRLTLKDLL